MIQKEIEGKQLKQVLHFRFSFEPRFSEIDKSLFLAPPLRTTSCNVHYSGPLLYDNGRETWSKSTNYKEYYLKFIHRHKFLSQFFAALKHIHKAKKRSWTSHHLMTTCVF